MQIDAHQHFWRLARGDYAWLTPELGPIHRDFGLDDLRPLLAAAGVERTVLVQAALQFPLGHPSVVCVIPGAQSPAEVMENLALLEAPIPDTLWRDLKRAGLMSLDAPAPMAA